MVPRICRNAFVQKFENKCPWLYHLTANCNSHRIRCTGRLDCAAKFLVAGGRASLVRERRKTSLVLRLVAQDVNPHACVHYVHVRDQAPLHKGHMGLLGGWSFKDWVEHLNSLVFFWPGDARGPIPSGIRHYERYKAERPRVIRVPTKDLFKNNGDASPLFSRYNSGAPRHSSIGPSPRGLDTFAFGDDCSHKMHEVIEVAYSMAAALPGSAELGITPCGPWRRLFD